MLMNFVIMLSVVILNVVALPNKREANSESTWGVENIRKTGWPVLVMKTILFHYYKTHQISKFTWC